MHHRGSSARYLNRKETYAVWYGFRHPIVVRKDIDALGWPECYEQAELVGTEVADRDDGLCPKLGYTPELLTDRGRHDLHLGGGQSLVPDVDRVDVEVASIRVCSVKINSKCTPIKRAPILTTRHIGLVDDICFIKTGCEACN